MSMVSGKVAALPAELARPLALVLAGCTYREAARRLGLEPTLVASRLSEALTLVRQMQ